MQMFENSHDQMNIHRSGFTPIVTPVAPTPVADTPVKLTPREQGILTLLAAGKTTAEMATELQISIKTVEAHRTNMFRKMGARNAPHVIVLAFRMGFLK
jgi:DNA-binding NarL/FixJ family response regulator